MITHKNIALAAIPTMAALIALGAGAGVANAAASPGAAGPRCTTGSSSGNIKTCFSITGGGLHVTSMKASATIENSARTLDVCITGPAAVLPLCTGFFDVPVGGTLSITWSPNANEPAGTYCGETFRLNNDGSATEIGSVCFNVHS